MNDYHHLSHDHLFSLLYFLKKITKNLSFQANKEFIISRFYGVEEQITQRQLEKILHYFTIIVMEWVSKMENVLLTVSLDDFKNFAALKMNKSDILSFIQGLKKKYETSKYKFLINENQLLNFPGIN